MKRVLARVRGCAGRARWAAGALCIYPAWLAMMALHESGHVFHAWLSGGRVRRVSVPLWGFSFTEFAANPHPLFVAWGGTIWGCIFPLAMLGIVARLAARPANEKPRCATQPAALFAGFCLVSNGAYLLTAIVEPVGDAADLARGGVSRYLLAAIGAAMLMGGLLLWHRGVVIHAPAVSRADGSIF